MEKNIQFHQQTNKQFIMNLFLAIVPLGIAAGIVKWVMPGLMDPSEAKANKESESARKRLEKRLKANGRPMITNINQYENMIISDITFPDQISVTFDAIGGLQEIKNSIYETVIVPLVNPELFTSMSKDKDQQSLLSAPSGVLFYGPPGTGKTMMAKAIARDCNATFINVRFSTLQNKYFGESQKLVRAVFSLAAKLAPTIIFIDEVDMFLRERDSSGGHEATGAMKAEFMTLWDGLTSDKNRGVCVLGATNRPFDLDAAILRRFPRNFLFDIPDAVERHAILCVILTNQRLSYDVDLENLAKMTDKYSGSDLHELCKYACMIPVREIIRVHQQQGEQTKQIHGKPRDVNMADLVEAMCHVTPSGEQAYEYEFTSRNQSSKFRSAAHAQAGNSSSSSSSSVSSSVRSTPSQREQQEAQLKSLFDSFSIALPQLSANPNTGESLPVNGNSPSPEELHNLLKLFVAQLQQQQGHI